MPYRYLVPYDFEEVSVPTFLSAFRPAIAAAVLAIPFASCAGAQTSPVPHATLQTQLQQDLQNYLTQRSSIEHISTLSMTVSFRGSQAPISLAVGTTQYGGGQSVTPQNLFQIGSNTKAFTSAIILDLEAQGLLSIHDTVGKWLPQYPAWANVTIQQLLDMTSGIPTYDGQAAFELAYAANPHAEFTPQQLVGYAYPQIQADPPFIYSNTNYILAQMIIDAASPSHDYQTELNNLIARLSLTDVFYEPDFYPSSVMNRLVAGYYVNTDDGGPLSALLGTETSGYSLGWTQAAGGIIATPLAMTTWVRDLFEGSVLPAQQLKELQLLVSVPGGQPIPSTSSSQAAGFGLGIFQITMNPMGTFWGYQGSTIGYRASYMYLPSSGLIVTIFTNSQTSSENNALNTVLMPAIYNTLKTAGKA